MGCLQLGRITTTKVPKQQSNTPEGNQGVGQSEPMGGQFGQQWDEQQFAPMQPAYNYGNPDVLSQVTILSRPLLVHDNCVFKVHLVILTDYQLQCSLQARLFTFIALTATMFLLYTESLAAASSLFQVEVGVSKLREALHMGCRTMHPQAGI